MPYQTWLGAQGILRPLTIRLTSLLNQFTVYTYCSETCIRFRMHVSF